MATRYAIIWEVHHLPNQPLSPDEDEALVERQRWRPWALAVVAGVLVAVMLGGPVLQTIDRAQPELAPNGLEVCGFDYCVVLQEVRAAGYGASMLRLAATRLTDAESQAFADDLTARLGERPVPVDVVDRLDGRTSGRFDPGRRVIEIERPADAWVVLHEVAHVASPGHGDAFIETLLTLLESLDQAVDAE